MDDVDFLRPLEASWHVIVTKKGQVHALNELVLITVCVSSVRIKESGV
jgi:hypothetical protein